MGLRNGIDAGEDLSLLAAAGAVLDPDEAAVLQSGQPPLDRADAGAVQIGKVIIRRKAISAGVGQGADLRIEQLRAGRKAGGIADLRGNDGPVAWFLVFDVSSPLFGDAEAGAIARVGDGVSIFA